MMTDAFDDVTWYKGCHILYVRLPLDVFAELSSCSVPHSPFVAAHSAATVHISQLSWLHQKNPGNAQHASVMCANETPCTGEPASSCETAL